MGGLFQILHGPPVARRRAVRSVPEHRTYAGGKVSGRRAGLYEGAL